MIVLMDSGKEREITKRCYTDTVMTAYLMKCGSRWLVGAVRTNIGSVKYISLVDCGGGQNGTDGT